MITECEEAIAELQEELHREQVKSIKHLNDITELTSDRDSSKACLEDTIGNLQTKVQELELAGCKNNKIFSEYKEVIEDLQGKLELAENRANEQSVALEQLALELETNKTQHHSVVDELNTQLGDLMRQLTAKDEAIASSSSEISTMCQKLAETESMYVAQTVSLEQIKIESDSLRNDLKATVESMSHDLNQFRSALASKEIEVADLTTKIGDLQHQLSMSIDEKDAFEQLVRERDATVTTFEGTVSRLTVELNEAKSLVAEKETIIEASLTRFNTLEEQLGIAQRLSKKQVTDLEDLILERESVRVEFETRIGFLNTELEGLRTFIAEKERAVEEASEVIASLKDKVSHLESAAKSLDQLEDAHEKLKAESIAVSSNLNSQIEGLLLSAAANDKVIGELNSRVTSLLEQLAEAESVSSHRAADFEQLRIEHDASVIEAIERLTP
jgi:chromosome segregation ATPase